MIRVKCLRPDSNGKLEAGSIYWVDTLDDVDSYVHIVGGRYIGMFPSKWFEEKEVSIE